MSSNQAMFGLFADRLDGMFVVTGTAGTAVKVAIGGGMFNGSPVTQEAAAAANDIAVSTTNGTYVLFLNVPGTIGTAGSTLTKFGFEAEANKTRTAINGSLSTTQGRSLALATITVAGGVVSAIDNSIRYTSIGSAAEYSYRNNAG